MIGMNTESIDIILETDITEAQLRMAKEFLAKFSFTTSAVYALSLAVRDSYNDAGEEDAPCADLIKQFACGALVQAESEEI